MSKNASLSNLIYNKILLSKSSLIKDWNAPEQTNTKHIIIDNLLPDELCTEIYDSFPKDSEGFHSRSTFRERKKTSANMSLYNKIINEAIYAFQDEKILNIISEITSIKGLEADKKLYAGGLSIMERGDFLNPHIDNSHNIKREEYRRLNILYYVTPNWCIENGGNFELWDAKVKRQKTIVSKFNRIVLMETTQDSWHSVSKVLTTLPRYCVSNYYFSKNSPNKNNNKYFHVTSFTGRPEENFKRVYGSVDNYFRNKISIILKAGRGKKLINHKK
tara:strand:+ start:99 stop:923 length:825 start_codon:yes stop_codon:yes gene_type:complete